MLFAQIAASCAVLLGIYLYEERNHIGPIISMWGCVLWAFITFALDQPAMVVLNLILAALHFRNLYTRRHPL
jgi:hypothetical protein